MVSLKVADIDSERMLLRGPARQGPQGSPRHGCRSLIPPAIAEVVSPAAALIVDPQAPPDEALSAEPNQTLPGRIGPGIHVCGKAEFA